MKSIRIGTIELDNDGELHLLNGSKEVGKESKETLTNKGETIEGNITISAQWLIEELMILRSYSYSDLLIHQIILAPFDFFNYRLTTLSKSLFGNPKIYADPTIINLPDNTVGYRYTPRVITKNRLENNCIVLINGKTVHLSLEPKTKTDNKGEWQINLPCTLNFINGIVSLRIELEDWNDLINDIFELKFRRNRKTIKKTSRRI